MRDESNVEVFADFMQSVIEKEHKVVQAVALGERIEIEKA